MANIASERSLQPAMKAPKKSHARTALWIFTLSAVVLFIVLRILVWRFAGTVRFKSQAELAKLPVSADSYPCLLVERASASEPLRSALRQCSTALNNDGVIEQYEVDLRSGCFVVRNTDLFVADSMPLALTRAYRLWDPHSRAFGLGGNQPYDIFPYGDQFPYTYMELQLGDGSTVHYDRISKGTGYADFVAEHNGVPPLIFQKSRMQWNGDHWDLRFQDGTLFRFPEAYHAKRGVVGALVHMRSAQGEEIKFVRDAAHNLKSITSPHNHRLDFEYDGSDRITRAADDSGNVASYSYDQNGRLTDVSQNGRLRWHYLYDQFGMTGIQDGAGKGVIASEYGQRRGRIGSLTLENKSTYQFYYLVDQRGRVEETTVTDPSGKTTTFRF